MRELYLLRGPQGAGKSSWIQQNGLAPYTLSTDAIRQLYGNLSMGLDGALGIPANQDKSVFALLMQLLERRMRQGDLTLVDATHAQPSAIAAYQELAARHRYAIQVVDFSVGLTLEETLQRNRQRPAHQVVPETAVHRTWERLAQPLPDFVTSMTPEAAIARIKAGPVDLSHWDAILHIGDLQGCYTVLKEALPTLDPAVLHIFHGDFLDRGIENAEVLQFIHQIMDAPNVVLIEGNHERHLWRWSQSRNIGSAEFLDSTLPQLDAAGLTPDMADAICQRLVSGLTYTYRGRRVVASHGGLSGFPEHLALISDAQLIAGVGMYDTDIDTHFEENTPPDCYQVHGHRNRQQRPLLPGQRSLNLEGRVEFGGHLRMARLDANGWRLMSHQNRVFSPEALRERANTDVTLPRPAQYFPAWVDALRQDDSILEKRFGHISAFNFKRAVFYDNTWTPENTRARGLFINNETHEIVARSYDKFFNVGERPETQRETLPAQLQYPVTAYVKDNGYLGIVGFDRATDQLFMSSKSNPESPFAEHFRSLFAAQLGPVAREKLAAFLRDQQYSAVFEVIDPVFDPHIVEYICPQLVLLDLIRNQPTVERLPYRELVEFGQQIGLSVKSQAAVFRDAKSLSGFMSACQRPDYRYRGQDIEGFVLEDSAGFMTKIKLPTYARWKAVRAARDRLLNMRAKTPDMTPDAQRAALRVREDPYLPAILDWLAQQPEDVLRLPIPQLRQVYENRVEMAPALSA